MRLKILLICVGFIFIVHYSYAQYKIIGLVTDSLNNPIANVTISLKLNETILKYIKTDNSGNYSLNFENVNKTSLIIEAKCLGYKSVTIAYVNSQTIYNIILKEAVINLDAINVKHKPIIIVKGDTINYRTADFANENDRSIGDVLKKMPGIAVAENGKVTYNNTPITQLYVDGDNLLDDKYNIGTKSIPHKAVSKIQIIDHDQPIKMLQKNSLSNDIAINLVIDKAAKLKVIGNAKLAAGFPNRYDEAVDWILLKQQFKFLDNVSFNNIGLDLSEDVISHNSNLNINSTENNRPNFQLSNGIASPPYLPKSRYLFNHSAIINTNNLFKFNAEKQLKANIYYLYHKELQNNNYNTEITLPSEKIDFGELQNNKNINQSIYSQFNYIDNAISHYVNNSLTIDYSPNNSNASIIGLQHPFKQRLSQKRLNFVNNLKYLKALKSGVILNVNSYLEKNNQTEFLGISPGTNEVAFNSNIGYDELIQQTNIPGFFTNNFLTYSAFKNRITQSYQVGFIYQNIDFNSNLEIVQNNNDTTRFNNGINAVLWNKFKTYLNPGLDYKTNAIHIVVRFPVSFNLIDYSYSKAYSRILTNPSLGFNYQINPKSKLTLGYSFNQIIGGIENIYAGNILKSYRSIIANNTPFPFAKSQRISAEYRYQKAISMFFASLQSSFAITALDNITVSTITKSIQTRNAISLANNITNFTINGSAGKYLLDLNTNISFDFGFSKSSGKQLQNNILFPFENNNSTIGINMSSKISKNTNWSLRSNYILTKNLNNGMKNLELHQLRQFSKFDATVLKRIAFSLRANHIFMHQANQNNLNYLFTDINLRYKLLKIKTDFELGLNNITNIKTFSTYYIDANSFTSSDYNIPGRYSLLKAVFSFN